MRKGVIIMPTYRIIFKQQGFRAAGTLYEPGDAVEVSYMTATDTSYTFTVDGARFERDYDPGRGAILRFIMPERDVTIGVESHSTMTFDPNALKNAFLGGFCRTGGGWLCPECGTRSGGKFCPECGRKRLG